MYFVHSITQGTTYHDLKVMGIFDIRRPQAEQHLPVEASAAGPAPSAASATAAAILAAAVKRTSGGIEKK